jgi:hypothetical protein
MSDRAGLIGGQLAAVGRSRSNGGLSSPATAGRQRPTDAPGGSLRHSVGQARLLRRLEGHCRCLFAHAMKSRSGIGEASGGL